MFTRPYGATGGDYYYQALRATIRISGTYTFTSSSVLDMYGILYNGSPNPSYPYQNLITYDDDTAGGGQFRMNASMWAGGDYVLIATTFERRDTGSFSVMASGPGRVDLLMFRPYTSDRPIRSSSKSSN